MANKTKQYQATAQAILDGVGGAANISQATHCMTRLRLNLKDESIPNDESIKKIPGVMGVNRSAGQYQVIIGQTVEKVYNEFTTLGNLTANAAINENLDKSLKEPLTLKRAASATLNKVAGSLTPLIPMLVAASMFKMLAAVFGPSMLHILTASSDLYRLFVFVGDAGFYFFPVIIGYTAAKQFNTSPIIAMFLGAIMIDPNLVAIVTAGKPFTVYGIPTTLVNYSSTLVPILLSVWVLSYVERFFKKYVPSALSTILVPTLTIAVMLPVTLTALGPVGGLIGNVICNGILSFGKTGGIWAILGIAILGALWEFLVITGMHLVIISAMIVLFAQGGHDNFASLGAIAASLSVAGMALGVTLRIRGKEEKALTFSYLVASLVGGVTEPALYGLAIRYRRPFIGMMIGGFAGGLFAGIVGITAYVQVPVANFLALTAYVGGNRANIINGILSGAIAFIVAAITTFIIGVEPKKKETEELKLVEAK